MTLRARLVALAVAVAVVAAGAIVVLARSANPGCAVAAPRPSLPDQLRSLGDFDQAYDANDVGRLQDVAQRAASALHSDLVGATAEQPVAIAAQAGSGQPAAIVVPLRAPASDAQPPPLHGLVVFLRDCAGNAYYASVEDDTTATPPPAAFPAVTSSDAAARLGGPVTLAYATDPLHPLWFLNADPSATLAAR